MDGFCFVHGSMTLLLLGFFRYRDLETLKKAVDEMPKRNTLCCYYFRSHSEWASLNEWSLAVVEWDVDDENPTSCFSVLVHMRAKTCDSMLWERILDVFTYLWETHEIACCICWLYLIILYLELIVWIFLHIKICDGVFIVLVILG